MKQEIPIFFAVDDGYIPFLAVALQSLSENINRSQFAYKSNWLLSFNYSINSHLTCGNILGFSFKKYCLISKESSLGIAEFSSNLCMNSLV